MAYTTFTFYTGTYHGDTIASTAFDKWEDKAADKIDSLTFDRLVDGLPTDTRANTKVQKAVCSLADLLYKIDQATQNATSTDEGNIKSKSSGSESITFGNNDTVVTAVLADIKAQDKLCYDTAKEYLSGVCDDNGVNLLFAGC